MRRRPRAGAPGDTGGIWSSVQLLPASPSWDLRPIAPTQFRPWNLGGGRRICFSLQQRWEGCRLLPLLDLYCSLLGCLWVWDGRENARSWGNNLMNGIEAPTGQIRFPSAASLSMTVQSGGPGCLKTYVIVGVEPLCRRYRHEITECYSY